MSSGSMKSCVSTFVPKTGTGSKPKNRYRNTSTILEKTSSSNSCLSLSAKSKAFARDIWSQGRIKLYFIQFGWKKMTSRTLEFSKMQKRSSVVWSMILKKRSTTISSCVSNTKTQGNWTLICFSSRAFANSLTQSFVSWWTWGWSLKAVPYSRCTVIYSWLRSAEGSVDIWVSR